MAKDNSPGLLSKVAMFVRNPTKDWAELEQPEPEQESGYSKQALKEMIERKRQNDFVRKREFDQLRKLRRREPGAPSEHDPARPSFFQSSMPTNPDDRAVTLKKIDEIEAQMSKQWWKGKQDEVSGRAPAGPAAQAPSAAPARAQPVMDDATRSAAERAVNFAPTQAPEDDSGIGPEGSDYASTVMSPALSPNSPGARAGAGTGAGVGRPSAPPPSRSASGFSTSQLFATELGDGGTDPDLEEAAIRFANGDDMGAEAGLLDALRGDKVTQECAEVWMAALFDFYRATDQQARFDQVGLDFAQRFGRSPPAWFSMPELLGLHAPADAKQVQKPTRKSQPAWVCPAELDLAAVEALRESIAARPAPVRLDWTALASVHSSAGNALAALFADWCRQDIALRFEGASNLERVLRARAPSGDKSVHQGWWQILMDAMRIMRLQDEFELVALDYCVTFEVSPPAWTEAVCGYAADGKDALAGLAVDAVAFGDSVPAPAWSHTNALAPTEPQGLGGAPMLVELNGEILGDAAAALAGLESGRMGADRLVVSCGKLIRVDFSAAGSILNWVAARQGEGCQIQFRDVHRLVAAFFHVIGITEHARVSPRTN